tara:strand:+ start:159 stop:677 length:519 start_codon:yes stop_codon:yes gene_type:complete
MSKRIGKYKISKRESEMSLVDGGTVTGILVGARRNVVALTDAAGAGAIRTALTEAESGTIFTVPELTSGTQTIALPAPKVGLSYTFVTVDTADQIFNVETDASATKILAVKPKGDGDNTAISQGYDKIGFKAAAVLGSMFTCTCISTTAAVAWMAHDVIDGLEANTAGINLA